MKFIVEMEPALRTEQTLRTDRIFRPMSESDGNQWLIWLFPHSVDKQRKLKSHDFKRKFPA